MTWSLDEIQCYIEEKESSLQFIATEGMKTCTACFETFPNSGFGKHKGRKDGLNSQCRACIKAKKKALDFDSVFGNLYLKWNKTNNAVTWYLEDVKGNYIGRNCYDCGKLKLIKEFSIKADGFKGYDSSCSRCYHRYRKENKSKISEQRRIRYYENKKDPIWWESHCKAQRETQRKLRKQNPEKDVAKTAKRRAMGRKLPADPHWINTWYEILERFDNRCVLSGVELQKSEGHLEHMIPLSWGHGGTIAENCVPMRGDLNMSKSNRNIFEWFEENKERFELEQERFDEMIFYLAVLNDMTPEEYREFVYWCEANQRTVKQAKADNKRFGRKVFSSELWKESKGVS